MYTKLRRIKHTDTMLNINDLHKIAVTGDKSAEAKLFNLLTERFEQFVHRRIWEEESVKDVVQDALMAIAKEYKEITIEKSFSAWAYKVLDNRILSYIKKKRQQEGRLVSAADPGSFSASVLTDAVEPLEQVWKMIVGDSGAVVTHFDERPRRSYVGRLLSIRG